MPKKRDYSNDIQVRTEQKIDDLRDDLVPGVAVIKEKVRVISYIVYALVVGFTGLALSDKPAAREAIIKGLGVAAAGAEP